MIIQRGISNGEGADFILDLVAGRDLEEGGIGFAGFQVGHGRGGFDARGIDVSGRHNNAQRGCAPDFHDYGYRVILARLRFRAVVCGGAAANSGDSKDLGWSQCFDCASDSRPDGFGSSVRGCHRIIVGCRNGGGAISGQRHAMSYMIGGIEEIKVACDRIFYGDDFEGWQLHGNDTGALITDAPQGIARGYGLLVDVTDGTGDWSFCAIRIDLY